MKPVFSKSLLIATPLAILAGGWLYLNQPSPTEISTPVTLPTPGSTPLVSVESNKSPGHSNPTASRDVQQQTTAAQPASTTTDSPDSESSRLSPDLIADVSKIGLEFINDDQFNELRIRLRHEPELLEALLTEFRFNTDSDRAKRIAALISDFNNPQILIVAKELAYSGNSDLQHIGLDMLSRIQPHNSDARDIAIELLTSETDPGLLVSTLNVLATPTGAASAQQRTLIVDNLKLLANHPSPRVRSQSISLLGAWDSSGADKAALVKGLTDQNETVRARSTTALIGKHNVGTSTLYALLDVAENTTELKTTRQSALYALQKMDELPHDIKLRYEQAVITVRRTRQ